MALTLAQIRNHLLVERAKTEAFVKKVEAQNPFEKKERDISPRDDIIEDVTMMTRY